MFQVDFRASYVYYINSKKVADSNMLRLEDIEGGNTK